MKASKFSAYKLLKVIIRFCSESIFRYTSSNIFFHHVLFDELVLFLCHIDWFALRLFRSDRIYWFNILRMEKTFYYFQVVRERFANGK